MATIEKVEEELKRANDEYYRYLGKLDRLEELREGGIEKYVGEREKLEQKEEELEKSKKKWEEDVMKWRELLRVKLSKEKENYPNHHLKLNLFWNGLKEAQDGDFIHLQEGVYLLGDAILGSAIFVRQCYRDFAEMIFTIDNFRNWCITGNPGVGKSFFAYYLLYLLAQQQKTVVFQQYQSIPILFSDGNVSTISNEFLIHLDNPDVWYIVDGMPPAHRTHGKTILVCSPRQKHYKEFQKRGSTSKRYMPTWTLKEIQISRQVCFPHLSEKEVKELYDIWGGIPRFVLEFARNTEMKNELNRAINVCKQEIFRYVGEVNSSEDTSHKLVHIYTNVPAPPEEIEQEEYVEDDENKEDKGDQDVPYTATSMRFASEYIAQRVLQHLKKHYYEDLRRFLIASEGEGSLSTLRGHIFENIAHASIANGGTFKVRPLDENAEDQRLFNCGSLPTLVFSDNTQIQTGKYCRPQQKQYESIDSLILPNTLFQITVGKKHRIRIGGLEKIVDMLGGKNSNDQIRFYFVVPPDRFDKFERQPYLRADGRIAKRVPPWIKRRVRQYILEIDLNLERIVSDAQ